jgi:hypothetical protein
MTDSPHDRRRVSDKITWAIRAFFEARLASGDVQFYADDLRRYVAIKVGDDIAPGSPDRIMRSQRQAGEINYTLVSRSQSLYRVLPA